MTDSKGNNNKYKYKLSFLRAAHRLMSIDIYMKFREDNLNGFQVIEQGSFQILVQLDLWPPPVFKEGFLDFRLGPCVSARKYVAFSLTYILSISGHLDSLRSIISLENLDTGSSSFTN